MLCSLALIVRRRKVSSTEEDLKRWRGIWLVGSVLCGILHGKMSKSLHKFFRTALGAGLVKTDVGRDLVAGGALH